MTKKENSKKILAFVRSIKSKSTVSKININKITKTEALKIKEMTGIDISSFTRVLDSSSVIHVMGKHGSPVEYMRG